MLMHSLHQKPTLNNVNCIKQTISIIITATLTWDAVCNDRVQFYIPGEEDVDTDSVSSVGDEVCDGDPSLISTIQEHCK